MLRSPVAHGKINGINVEQAKRAEGVVAVITSDDLIAGGVRDMPCKIKISSRDGTEMPVIEHPVLATGKMLYFGEPVAAVIATSKLLAKDAAELIELDYDELPAAASASVALAPDAPQLWPQIKDNLACDWVFGDEQKNTDLFSEADHVVSLETIRSEERRVGKECRARWSPYH